MRRRRLDGMEEVAWTHFELQASVEVGAKAKGTEDAEK